MFQNVFFFSVFYFNHMNLFANGSAVFLLKEQFCHGVQDMNDFFMPINIQFPIQTFFCNILTKQTHNPDNSHNMVYVFMRNKDICDFPPVNIRIF